MKKELEAGGVGGREKNEAKTVSYQGSKFNSAAPVYRGKNHKTHPLFQLDYVAKQAQGQSLPLSSCGKLQVQQGL